MCLDKIQIKQGGHTIRDKRAGGEDGNNKNQAHLVGISILRAGKDEKRCKIVVLSFAQRHLHLACKPLDSHRRREHRTNIVACCKNGQSQLKEYPSHSLPSRDGKECDGYSLSIFEAPGRGSHRKEESANGTHASHRNPRMLHATRTAWSEHGLKPGVRVDASRMGVDAPAQRQPQTLARRAGATRSRSL